MLPRPPPAPDRAIALFLDFDGTLVDIAPRPGEVVVSDTLRTLLESLHEALDGAVAVVSGRRLADLLEHLAPLRLAAAGSHGLEYQLQGGHSRSASKAGCRSRSGRPSRPWWPNTRGCCWNTRDNALRCISARRRTLAPWWQPGSETCATGMRPDLHAAGGQDGLGAAPGRHSQR